MGKNLISQKRGKGSPSYRSPGFRFKGQVGVEEKKSYEVVKLMKDPAHTAPVAKVVYDDDTEGMMVMPEGIKEGDKFTIGKENIASGNVMTLKDIPLGTSIFNIESIHKQSLPGPNVP